MSEVRIVDRMRSRPFVDKLMLVAVLIVLLIGLGRFVRVAAVVPYAAYNLQQKTTAAKEAGRPPSKRTVFEVFAEHRYFRAWWGGRRVPYRAGGDYLAVVTHHSANRTLGTVLGTVVERELEAGARIDEVIVPEDVEALLGAFPGTSFTGADGVTFTNPWASIGSSAGLITEVPVTERPYQPLLNESEVAELESVTPLSSQTDRFLLAEPAEDGSGTWILHSRVDGKRRTFILMPLEFSPRGDEL